MPTYYVEDFDGDRNDDAVEPVTLAPVVDDAEGKIVPANKVEDKAVKPAAKKATAKKKG